MKTTTLLIASLTVGFILGHADGWQKAQLAAATEAKRLGLIHLGPETFEARLLSGTTPATSTPASHP